MNPKTLIEHPTIKNLTEYALENVPLFMANSQNVPFVDWCVGEREIKVVECPFTADENTLAQNVECWGDVLHDIGYKAGIRLCDRCIEDDGLAPNQIAEITVNSDELEVVYLYSIQRDMAGKLKLGEQLGEPVVTKTIKEWIAI